MLPFNTGELPNAGSGPKYFLAGDVRANEQVRLTALHTVFVREHNRLADEIRARSPRLPGDDVYQQTRAVVGAEMQAITYKEFLPILLGPGALRRYGGFRPDTDPSISNIFAAAAYRFGHSMLNSRLLRLDARGREIAAGHLSLAEAFFRPDRMLSEGGIEPILRGLAAQTTEDVDVYVVDEVRNFLFGPPGAGGMDLVSLNIQRGRDHGLPDYNSVRVALGLEPVTTFPQISSNPEIQNRLHDAYGSVDDIDVWVGSLAEDHVEGAMVGELTRAILADQFERLRDGDRFWYWRIFSGTRLVELESTTLAKVIQRNSTIGDELPAKVVVSRDRCNTSPRRRSGWQRNRRGSGENTRRRSWRKCGIAGNGESRRR